MVEIRASAELHKNATSHDLFELRFSVQDNGIGIAPQHLKKLFHSFSQADTSTTRRFGGSGLGLAICKGLCEKMGGRIWVESEENKGSTFTFTFIAERTHLSQPSDMTEVLAEADDEFAQRYPLKILVAEDNHVDQLVIKGMLKKLGYQAELVENGLMFLISLNNNRTNLF